MGSMVFTAGRHQVLFPSYPTEISPHPYTSTWINFTSRDISDFFHMV